MNEPSIHIKHPATFIDSLQTREVRMLANAVFGEPLLRMTSTQIDFQNLNSQMHGIARAPSFSFQDHSLPPIFSLDRYYQRWLLQLDRQAESLIQYLQCKGQHKLGIYYERLWQYFLANNNKTQLLAANLSARENKIDLGEFDIIYRHEKLGVVHLEISCKFFLASRDDTPSWNSWLGPTKRDRLDLKLNHCINQQINLADQKIAGEQLLAHINLANENYCPQRPLAKSIHIGGRLFYRASTKSLLQTDSLVNKKKEKPGPARLNLHHLRGFWLLQSEWGELVCSGSIEYVQLLKPFWLDTNSGLNQLLDRSPNSNSAIPNTGVYRAIKEISNNNSEHSRLFVYRKKLSHKAAKAAPHITSQCFVVPDNWLES